VLSVTQCSIPDDIHSIIRTSWFKNGQTIEVDEVRVPECDDAIEAFQHFVGGALKRGCDVCVMTTYPPKPWGSSDERQKAVPVVRRLRLLQSVNRGMVDVLSVCRQ
jgi:hypothetical protein